MSDRILEERFYSVPKGAADIEILRVFGRPEKVTGRPKHVAWGDDPVWVNDVGCVKEFWYRPIINIVDEEYTIGFDEGGRVVSKYHYISQ